MTERKSSGKKIRRSPDAQACQKMLKRRVDQRELSTSSSRAMTGTIPHVATRGTGLCVYKELDISKLEMSLKELRSVWGVVDINGDNTVTVEEFASFIDRMEANKIDHVILETVDKQLVEGRAKQPPPSPTKTTEGARRS